ncbi:MAG: aspartate ammonia-lyase [Verrucomicrobia bacterium]|nr:aspartate ammonia-lyase [Verrucomicrobiota bacterium]
MPKLTHGLSGTAGEYHAAAELSRRGYLATITNKNAESVDILAARPNSGRALKIQVKTTQSEKAHWVLREKDEEDHGPGFFYIFVRLGALGTRPDFHIVPGRFVAKTIKKGHSDWLKGMKKDGSRRKDTNMRGFWDDVGTFKEKCQLLKKC